jgi:prepilin-type processing-associated H-X9-DG protein
MLQPEVKRPAEVVMLCDYGVPENREVTPSAWFTYYGTDSGEGATYNYTRAFPHFDGGNICFVDGHVKWASRVGPYLQGGYTNTYWNAFS